MSKKLFNILSVCILSIGILHGLITIPELSITGDEADHLNYAARFVKGHPEKVRPFDDASTMPISALNMLPRMIEQVISPGLKKNDGGVSDIFFGRYVTLFVSLLTGVFILIWSTEMYGRLAGLFSLFLFVFCPNLSAHSVLVTTDAYSALFTIMSAYFFWRLVQKANYANVFLFALALGLAQIAKQSLTHLFIIYVLLYFILRWKETSLWKRLRQDVPKMAFATLVIVAVINIGFQFQKTGMPLKEYNFRSSFFSGVQRNFSFFGSVPLPLPKPYVQGLDLTKNIDEMGGGRPESSPNIYLLGQQKAGDGFWYYYFVVLFFKTPIPVLIFSFLLFASFGRNHKNFCKNEFISLFIIGYLLIYFDFFYKSQVGIRHIIMVFPLLYVLLGRLLQWFENKILFSVLLLYSVVSFYYYFPNLIAYTNEFVLPKRNAYKFMADSNIDYRQSYFWLQRYLKEHPTVRLATHEPVAGKVIVNVNDYLDLNNEHKFRWLQHFEPVAQIQHSYLLFNVTEKDLKTIRN
jgi:hypothetical protein